MVHSPSVHACGYVRFPIHHRPNGCAVHVSIYIYIYICFFVGGLYCIDLFFCRGCSFLIFLHKLTTSIFLLASTDRSMEKSARVSIALHSYSCFCQLIINSNGLIRTGMCRYNPMTTNGETAETQGGGEEETSPAFFCSLVD
jgi:hypothetical protein